MADTKNDKAPAEKKVVIDSVESGIKELTGADVLRQAISDGLVVAEIDQVEIESGKYSGDYVKLSLGPQAKDDASILAAMRAIAGGNVTAPLVKAEKEGDPDEPDNRAPSVTKFFLYGADLAARSRTSQRIKAAAEGPDKAIERMAKLLVANKPGLTMDQAKQMAGALLAD